MPCCILELAGLPLSHGRREQVNKCKPNFLCHADSACLSLMGQWWNKNVLIFLELSAYMYIMCVLYSSQLDEIAQVCFPGRVNDANKPCPGRQCSFAHCFRPSMTCTSEKCQNKILVATSVIQKRHFRHCAKKPLSTS